MEIVVHRDPAAFEAVAGGLLTADPVGNTVALTVLDGMVRGGHPAALLLTAHRDGVVLFTDLGNETTNRIYPRIGYRPLADSVVARFSSPG